MKERFPLGHGLPGRVVERKTMVPVTLSFHQCCIVQEALTTAMKGFQPRWMTKRKDYEETQKTLRKELSRWEKNQTT